MPTPFEALTPAQAARLYISALLIEACHAGDAADVTQILAAVSAGAPHLLAAIITVADDILAARLAGPHRPNRG